jgi:ATP-binding cassette subfamily B protein
MCSILFIFAGLFFIKAGYAQMGDVAAIYIMYTALSEKFMQVGKYYPELMNCVTYAEKLMDFLESKEDEEFININDIKTNRKMNINTVSSAIQFRDVSFSYNNDRKILNHLSFDIQPNENVAIIGKSGTGKSTIAKLMLGYYKQQRGEIYIFDKTFESWGLETVRKLIAYVPQEAYLFETTIMENIRYGNIHASDHDVIEAAKAANAHSFIMKVHDKYLYKICQRGSNLSGGERQRVAIARAIIKNTPIIIFDEATSALDGESEMAINDSITKLKKTKTIITIAHRQNTIDMADRKVEIVI